MATLFLFVRRPMHKGFLPQKQKQSNEQVGIPKFVVNFLCNFLGAWSAARCVQRGDRPHGEAGDGLRTKDDLMAGAGVYCCVLR